MGIFLAILFIGFSVFSILLFIINSFLKLGINQLDCSKRAGALLLFSVLILQLAHGYYLQSADFNLNFFIYKLSLFVIAPAFYFYIRGILTLQNDYTPSQLIHFFPIVFATFLELNTALTLAFLLGSFYLLWLGFKVYQLKQQRQRFKLELIALGCLFIIALLVINLVMMRSIMDEKTFFSVYASLIGLALFIALFIDLHFPKLSAEITEIVQTTYAESTLTLVDCDNALKKLMQLMEVDKLYQNENLHLSLVADELNLSVHQLSELINSHLHKGFSRYLREYRVLEAKQLLLNEPENSVLSIGLAVGFSSQSNFYTAFGEIEGLAPGQYRKQHLQN